MERERGAAVRACSHAATAREAGRKNTCVWLRAWAGEVRSADPAAAGAARWRTGWRGRELMAEGRKWDAVKRIPTAGLGEACGTTRARDCSRPQPATRNLQPSTWILIPHRPPACPTVIRRRCRRCRCVGPSGAVARAVFDPPSRSRCPRRTGCPRRVAVPRMGSRRSDRASR